MVPTSRSAPATCEAAPRPAGPPVADCCHAQEDGTHGPSCTFPSTTSHRDSARTATTAARHRRRQRHDHRLRLPDRNDRPGTTSWRIDRGDADRFSQPCRGFLEDVRHDRGEALLMVTRRALQRHVRLTGNRATKWPNTTAPVSLASPFGVSLPNLVSAQPSDERTLAAGP